MSDLVTTSSAPILEDDVCRGVRAYAERQANIQDLLVRKFSSLWFPALTLLGLESSWMDDFKSPEPSEVSALDLQQAKEEDEEEVGLQAPLPGVGDADDGGPQETDANTEDLDLVASNDILLQALEDSLADG